MADTVEQIILDVQSVCPDADPNLARLWVRDAARRTFEVYPWSFLTRQGQLYMAAPVTNVSSSSTCSLTQGSDEVEFSQPIVTESMVGRQFRKTTTDTIHDITGYISTTKVRIFPAWNGPTAVAQPFSIFHSRVVLPNDCQEIISVVAPSHRWQLWLGVSQDILDYRDPGRTRISGDAPYLLSPFDYSTIQTGKVSAAIQIVGTGDKPIVGTDYTGQNSAIFTVQITLGGVGGDAQFKWKKNEGAFSAATVSDVAVGNTLQDNVTVLFNALHTYNLNDIFVIRAEPGNVPGVARMEVYPAPSSEKVLPILYIASHPDITGEGVELPGIIGRRGDIIREKALEFAATWPGTEERPNPYNQINRRDYHQANWMRLVLELTKQDNALFGRNTQQSKRMPYAPFPFAGYNPQEFDPYFPLVDLY